MENGKRFRGFISYSQKDKKQARRLQQWLESYRIPPGISNDGATSLGRFFRDDDEIGVAADIGAALRGAIEDSESLIVICSPRSARSKWVDAEIRYFRNTSRADKVFAVIIDGDPNAAADEDECLPPSFRSREAGNGSNPMPTEPLAIDLRKENRTRACMRLTAGLLGVEFDSLWRREKRRRLRNMAMAFSIASMLAGFIVWTMIQAKFEADTARFAAEQAEKHRTLLERNAELDKITKDIGDGDAEAAIRRLISLRQRMPNDAVVNEVIRSLLGWIRKPEESIRDAAESGVFWNGTSYIVRTIGDMQYEISRSRPVRRIGFSHDRALTIYQDRIDIAYEKKGKIIQSLSEKELASFRNFDWSGLSFETPDGFIVLFAEHKGVSNGSTYPAILTIDVKNEGFSVTPPMTHPLADGNPWISRGDGVYMVANNCSALGVAANKQQNAALEGSYFTYKLQSGLPAGAIEAQDPTNTFNFTDFIVAPRILQESGCILPRYDTALGDQRARLGGQVIGIRLGDSPPPRNAWTLEQLHIGGIDRYGYAMEWNDRPSSTQKGNPCVDSECQTIVLGDFNDSSFSASMDAGTSGWVTNTPLTGRALNKPSENGEPLYTFFSQDNHSFVAAWCLPTENKARCFYHRRYMEISSDLKLIDIRSSSGRYLAYTPESPFKVMDLFRLRDVSPIPEVILESGLVDFDRSGEDRIIAAHNNRLDIFEPDASGQFENASSVLNWARDLSSYGSLTRLLSLHNNDILLITRSGRIVRLDWRNGLVHWSSGAPSIGDIDAIKLSENAQWLAVFGEHGIRILRLSDGLLISGILHPPQNLNTDSERGCSKYGPPDRVTSMLSDARISNSGALTVWCGKKSVRYTPSSFSGDIDSRLADLL